MPAWLGWVLAAVALAVGELATPGLFFLGPVSLAAVAAAIVSALGAGWVISTLVFVGAAVASLAVLRPVARAHLRIPIAIRTGTARLVGEPALVIEQVDSRGGLVKIHGEIWTARALEPNLVLEPGASVVVAEIQGATALVYE
jgi:membrane protein implicated in regulation of membrane protease activity